MKILLMGTMLLVLVIGVTQAHAANAWCFIGGVDGSPIYPTGMKSKRMI